jgi:hypothetical protein
VFFSAGINAQAAKGQKIKTFKCANIALCLSKCTDAEDDEDADGWMNHDDECPLWFCPRCSDVYEAHEKMCLKKPKEKVVKKKKLTK